MLERDLIGYGGRPPIIAWPHHARIAINFVINYEEGSESNILDGDECSESYLTDLPGALPLKGERHLSVESLFEYGSRAGVWRLLHLFEESQIPITFFVTGLALERNQPLAEQLAKSPHEVAGHGYRWINYRTFSEDLEREHFQKTLSIIQNLTQKKVSGWYTGRRSPHTRSLVVEAGLRYDSESYADDLPYWVEVHHHPHLIIPYSLETNDFRYAVVPGWSQGEDCFQSLKGTFDELYREGMTSPKMMTVGLHPRFSGRPGRTDPLRRFIHYIQQYEKVWICKREEIADYWYQQVPPSS